MPSERDGGRPLNSWPTTWMHSWHSQQDTQGIVQACPWAWRQWGQRPMVDHWRCLKKICWWVLMEKEDVGWVTHSFFMQTMMTSLTGRSTYVWTNSSRTIAVAVVIHASSQLASWKYWSLCHGFKTVQQNCNWVMIRGRALTHGYSEWSVKS
jgi:hypothetical protein